MKSEKRQLMKIAVHEAGHAVVSYYLKTPLKYATIVPDKKGRNLGHVRQRLVRFDSDGEFDHMLGESRRISRFSEHFQRQFDSIILHE